MDELTGNESSSYFQQDLRRTGSDTLAQSVACLATEPRVPGEGGRETSRLWLIHWSACNCLLGAVRSTHTATQLPPPSVNEDAVSRKANSRVQFSFCVVDAVSGMLVGSRAS
uniref:Uncharacterized protein n=1 Tax=Timema bartmani TaxID=61472 RepID=A0A7R9F7P8_9NEOP|nr:unnamed protein product [Timema bartmani]